MRLTFDRGTVLLHDPMPSSRAARLPGVVWDPRVDGWRAMACRYVDIRSTLRDADLELRDEIGPAIRPRQRLEPPALRPYQGAALEAWRLARGRGVVVLPTGAGKTRVGIAAVASSGISTLCLVPTRVLLQQWVERLTEVCPHPVGCLGDGRRRLEHITVGTFASAWRHMARLGDRFGLLVVDEAHHFGLGQQDEALEMSVAPFRLGLTATPPGPAAGERLAELVGPVVFSLSVEDLTGSYLAELERVVWHVDLRDDERLEYEREMAVFRAVHRPFFSGMPGASWNDFARAASRSDAGRRALSAMRRARRLLAYPQAKVDAVSYLLRKHRESRTLLFTPDNATAYTIARRELVMPLTCDISRAERAEALERFRGGELRALVSSRVLNEGLDVPDAEVAIIVGGGHGAREHVQRIGRVLRPAAGKKALVYELVCRNTSETHQARKRERGLVA